MIGQEAQRARRALRDPSLSTKVLRARVLGSAASLFAPQAALRWRPRRRPHTHPRPLPYTKTRLDFLSTRSPILNRYFKACARDRIP